MNVIDTIISMFLNPLGEIIYGIFHSIYILVSFIILLVSLFVSFLIKRKISLKKIVLLFISFLLVSYLILVIPFERGKKIKEIEEYGYRIVSEIEQFNNRTGLYPKSVEQIKPFLIGIDNFDSEFNYRYLDKDSINQKYKQSTPMTENIYFLTLSHKILGFDLFKYNNKDKKFILTDK